MGTAEFLKRLVGRGRWLPRRTWIIVDGRGGKWLRSLAPRLDWEIVNHVIEGQGIPVQ
jgi:hypothetical protein